MNYNFDVIVVGAGHAGIEAAAASARMKCKTLLITLSFNKIGWMPCNPAVGGIGKGHLVFEIAALGGIMPQLCTQTYLQANMLNESKGPAVQGLRLQIDKIEYAQKASELLKDYSEYLILKEGMVKNILTENNQVLGIETEDGEFFYSKNLILTTGTFLNGLVHMGLKNFSSGRKDEPAVSNLAKSINNLNLRMGRLKTGTPPRLKKSSVNISILDEQISHDLNSLFEFKEHKVEHKHSSYITRTNQQTHDIIFKSAHLSPIYRGDIKGIAPRYCPSIEDKINRFKHKDSHNIFIEPESLHLDEVYPNGLSTSLPLEIQEQFIRSIRGFEDAIIVYPGYAIEYDFIYPNQLKETLESKIISGLFFAGQINGTTGYEEAASQGIMAGINAACNAQNKEPFIISRYQGYIGIMIHDLVSFSVDEPYRMFTSRAENRLSLRQDNAFYRLYEKAYEYGLINEEAYLEIKKSHQQSILVESHFLLDAKFKTLSAQLISQGEEKQVKEYITNNPVAKLSNQQERYVFSEILYAPYIKREEQEMKKMKEYAGLKIPDSFNYIDIPGLSIELQQKLTKFKPVSLLEASLISGITPAAISLLIFRLQEHTKK